MILGEYVRAKGQPLRSLWYVYDWEIQINIEDGTFTEQFHY